MSARGKIQPAPEIAVGAQNRRADGRRARHRQQGKGRYRAVDKTFHVHLDGYNLLPYLKGETQEWPRLWASGGCHSPRADCRARGMSVTQTYLGHNNKFTGTIQEVTVEVKGGCGLPALG